MLPKDCMFDLEIKQKKELYLSYAPPAYEYGTRPFLRWVLSQGRSPTRQGLLDFMHIHNRFSTNGLVGFHGNCVKNQL